MSRPLALILCSLALLALPAATSAAEPEPPFFSPLGLYGPSGGLTELSRLDPLTLAPQGPAVEIPEWHNGYALSADGRQAAFTISTGAPVNGAPNAGRGGIRLVDLDAMRVTTDVQVGVAAMALAYLAPRRLIGVTQGGEVVVVKPSTGRVLSRPGRVPGPCIDPPGKATTGRLLVMLLGNRLVTVDKRGRTRTATLAGMAPECSRLGLAVDSSRDRAQVVGAGPRMADVDLRTMRVTYRAVRGSGPERVAATRAVGLDDGRVAAAHSSSRGLPKGVEVVDPRAGTRRLIDRGAGAARLAPGLVLTYDGRNAGSPGGSEGLRAFDRQGRPRFRMLAGEVVHDVQVLGYHAYARAGDTVHVIDLRAHAVVGRSQLPSEREMHFVVQGGAGD